MSGGVHTVLQALLVQRFYQINTGFFLLIFLLLFGIIDPGNSLKLHYAVMQLMAARPILLLGGLAIWTAYYIKCIAYCLNTIGDPKHRFLFELQALPARRFRIVLTSCLSAIYAPVLVYSLITAVVAFTEGRLLSLAIILAYQAGALAAGVVLCHQRIMHAARETFLGNALARLQALRPHYIAYHQYLMAYALHQKKMLLFLLKTGSLLMLQVMVAINHGAPEWEGTFYILLFIIVAHGLLPYYFVRFTEANGWLRNLPLSHWQRFRYFAGFYALLFIPELLFLVIHVHTSLTFGNMLSFYTLAIAVLCWLHTLLYLRGITLERYTLILGCLFLITMILLTSVSVWVIAAAFALMAVLAFPLLYPRYEVAAE